MLRLASLLLLGSFALSAQAPAPDKNANIYVVTFIDVGPNTAKDAAALLKQFAEDSRKEPGCIRFEALRDFARTNHLTVWEVWSNRDAFEAHLATAHSKLFREKLQPMLGSPFDERLHIILP